jgi:hypothetical protein
MLLESAYTMMSQERDAVLQPEHVIGDMPRKPLDSPRGRDSLKSQWNRPRIRPAVSLSKRRDVGSDAQQVELLATRRRIVSTTSRPRDVLMS